MNNRNQLRPVQLISSTALFVISALLPSVSFCEEPEKVSLCELQKDVDAFNHKLIEVTAFVSHGFEDFTLFDPTCNTWPAVWLEYGGKRNSGTMYCCGVTSERSRRKPLVVEEIPVPLVEDESFVKFDQTIARQSDSIVHASLVGRFFAGKKMPIGTGFLRGYGHMGCCSLLAIQQVISVDSEGRQDLDYGASAPHPELKGSCAYENLTEDRLYEQIIEEQREAEAGESNWRFSDPKRVAIQKLAALLSIETSNITGMKATREDQSRVVFQWRRAKSHETEIVVVSRPYWLSFYAKDPKQIAWVVIAAYKATCGKGATKLIGANSWGLRTQ
jgi:hypothetical protein